MKAKLRKGTPLDDVDDVPLTDEGDKELDAEIKRLERENKRERALNLKKMSLSTKELEVKKRNLQLKTEVKKLEREVEGPYSGPLNINAQQLVHNLLTNPDMQKRWLEMDPGQRLIIESTISRVTGRGGADPMLAISTIPLMMKQMQANPQSQVKDMIEIIKLVQPQSLGGSSLLDTVKVVKELIPAQNVKNVTDLAVALNEVKHLKESEGSLPTQIQAVTELATMMGFKRGEGQTSQEFEKWRMIQEHQWETDRLDRLSREKRSERVFNTFMGLLISPGGQNLMQGATSTIGTLGKNLGKRVAQQQVKGEIREAELEEEMTKTKDRDIAHCNPPEGCGKTFYVHRLGNGKWPTRAQCPNCGLILDSMKESGEQPSE